MKIITKKDIMSEVTQLSPYKIAVGYIGNIYKDVLNGDISLTKILTSTLPGNNKNVILDINNSEIQLGIIKNLHTKLYIGEYGAIIGSANLTSFGLSPNAGNEEICIYVPSGCAVFDDLNTYFDELYSRSELDKERINNLVMLIPDIPTNNPHRDLYGDEEGEYSENINEDFEIDDAVIDELDIDEPVLQEPEDGKVWIVPGGERGWHEYMDHNVYICRPAGNDENRKKLLNQVSMIGFYAQSDERGNPAEIKRSIAKVITKKLNFTVDITKDDMFNLIMRRIIESRFGRNSETHRYNGQKIAIFELSSEISDDTINLANVIPNDKVDKNGNPTAFTQNPVFVALSELENYQTTSNIVLWHNN